jgi:two-component system, OmpR family, response regulator MprA
MAQPRILLAEDDRAVRDSLQRLLRFEGYSVEAVSDGAQAVDVRNEEDFDLIILDWMMPEVDGLAVCRYVRRCGDDTPLLMLTAKTDTSDRVAGLDAGADDYLTKPFEADELLARVRALLRRGNRESSTLRLEDLVVDVAGRRATRDGRDLALTKIEFDLLAELVNNSGTVLSPTQLYERIWGYDFGPDSKNLTVYVGYLRRKLEDGGASRLIHTVRGVGYVARP